MQKNFLLLGATALALALTPNSAWADEVWSTEEYDVIYQEDRGRTSVWTYGTDGMVFIDGLAGIYRDRGSYSGYWVQATSSLRCDTYREGADGEPTYHWGHFEVTFIDPDFPSRWQADISLCDGDPIVTLNGTPITN
ncbi:MAG: hypothetical protein AAFX78_00205 [Cyanobacteria bacterium J06638_20]